MSDTPTAMPSLADRVRPIAANAPVVGAHFLGKTPVFVLGEEALLFAGDEEQRVAIHGGGILASASDGARIVTGGDDGTLVATEESAEHCVLATDDKRRGSIRSRSARTAPSLGRRARSLMCSPKRASSAPSRRHRPLRA